MTEQRTAGRLLVEIVGKWGFAVLILALLGSTLGAIFIEPSEQEQPGRCYQVAARSWWLFLAGNRRSEVACP